MDRIGIRYGLVGDSSLYTKRNNKKKSYISTVLRDKYRFVNLTERVFPGGGVQDLKVYLERCPEFDVLGISYFGNEHTSVPMNVNLHRQKWNAVFHHLRQKVHSRVVFFMGGYAAKYSYGRVYDENLAMIKKWIKAAGYQVVEARQEVSGWELASDKLHFSAECLPELAAFWSHLLMPRKFVQPGKKFVQPGKRQREPEVPIEPAKKVARKVVKEVPGGPNPRDKWLLPKPPQRPQLRSVQRDPAPSEESCSSDEWTKGQERAARLERDKKKLNDELAQRRMRMLKARGLLPPEPLAQPRCIPPRR